MLNIHQLEDGPLYVIHLADDGHEIGVGTRAEIVECCDGGIFDGHESGLVFSVAA